MRTYCTLSDKNYLLCGLGLIESLEKYIVVINKINKTNKK